MACRVRIRTLIRLALFFTAAKIISDYNEREWGWLDQKEIVDEYLQIRVYSVYLKDQEKLPENVVGFVSFEDFEIPKHAEMYHTQHLVTLVKNIGDKFTKIVVNPVGSKDSKSQATLSSLLMRTLVYENLIRSYKGIPKVEIYYYVSGKIVEFSVHSE